MNILWKPMLRVSVFAIAFSGCASVLAETQLMVPDFDANGKDLGADGTLDEWLPQSNNRQAGRYASHISRSVFEYSLAEISSVSEAKLIAEGQYSYTVGDPYVVEVHGYAGNGSADDADYFVQNIIATQAITAGITPDPFLFEFDVTDFVTDMLDQGSTHVGFMFRADTEALPLHGVDFIGSQAGQPERVVRLLLVDDDRTRARLTLKETMKKGIVGVVRAQVLEVAPNSTVSASLSYQDGTNIVNRTCLVDTANPSEAIKNPGVDKFLCSVNAGSKFTAVYRIFNLPENILQQAQIEVFVNGVSAMRSELSATLDD